MARQGVACCGGSKSICRDCQPALTAGTDDEAFPLERLQCGRDGLTGGADRLAKEFVRERKLDFDTAIDCGTVRTRELK